MQLPRFVGLVDLGIITIILVAIVLPPREMHASAAMKGTAAEQYALALSEARMLADPTNGEKISELSSRLGNAGFRDWAIETAVLGAEKAKGAPSRWRALQAASVAYVDRLDVHPALEYIVMARSLCEAHRDTCPSWEDIRMQLYHQHLEAGVKSGIDPRKDPVGFRKAGSRVMPTVHLKRLRGGP